MTVNVVNGGLAIPFNFTFNESESEFYFYFQWKWMLLMVGWSPLTQHQASMKVNWSEIESEIESESEIEREFEREFVSMKVNVVNGAGLASPDITASRS